MTDKSRMTLIKVSRRSIEALVKLIYIRMQTATSVAKRGNVRERVQHVDVTFLPLWKCTWKHHF